MTNWKKGKVKRYTAGATAVLFEGQKEGEKEDWIPVIEEQQKKVLFARWGAELEYRIGTWSDSKGNVKGIDAVKVLKEGPKQKRNSSNGKTQEEREEIIRMNSLKHSFDFIKLNMATFTDERGKVSMGQVIRQAEVFKEYVVEGKVGME